MAGISSPHCATVSLRIADYGWLVLTWLTPTSVRGYGVVQFPDRGSSNWIYL